MITVWSFSPKKGEKDFVTSWVSQLRRRTYTRASSGPVIEKSFSPADPDKTHRQYDDAFLYEETARKPLDILDCPIHHVK